MSGRFLDTNILLRHLLADDPKQSPACFALIQAIEQGKVAVWTTPLAIAEVVFVLANRRTYNRSRVAIRDHLLPLIHLPGLKLPDKHLYQRVFDLYTTHPAMSFIDAYHIALLEHRGEQELYSYDTDFDAVAGIVRIEPEAP